MLPPSDSLTNQCHKLSEALPSSACTGAKALLSPPPYSAAAPYQSSVEDIFCETDYSEDEEDTSLSTTKSIQLHINASIRVVGNGNTIIVPSSATANSTPISAPQPTPKQTKLTEIATGIIAELGHVGYFHGSRAGSPPPSTKISINAGIRLEGSRNLICTGIAPRVVPKKPAPKEPAQGSRGLGRKRSQNRLSFYSQSVAVCLSGAEA
ncbi:hypothetical protein FE257_004846 [Aspergillus nanangensis]|uniref:Uncharacterized protein n=1 Tax=Aspergillus nanangensis TaxID=2582783 RepID=A0AAD4GVX4_ASPNN|nr:hypothetical protein FE257_004846 [Aspergillus nanangensis]